MITPVEAPPIQSASWRALGTGVRLVVHDGDLRTARAAVEALLDRVDRTCSRFRPDSELVALHARPGFVPVSPLLADAIETALRAAEQTDGAVDPTVGRAMRAIGYDADFATLGARSGPIELRLEPIPGWQAVELSRVRGAVRLRPGVELDLGSTGKAFAADLAAAAALVAVDRPGAGVLVSLGGDIATAGDAPVGGWRILVAEDSEVPADADGETIAIPGGAIATSSTTVRRWRRADRELHHLVDPRTGQPAISPWRTVTVVADTCVRANTEATAAIVRGESGLERLAATGLPARLVDIGGHVVRLNGWPDPELVS